MPATRSKPYRELLSFEKYCCGCETIKPKNEFYKRTDSKDGHQSHCKKCDLGIQRHRYNVRREAMRITTVTDLFVVVHEKTFNVLCFGTTARTTFLSEAAASTAIDNAFEFYEANNIRNNIRRESLKILHIDTLLFAGDNRRFTPLKFDVPLGTTI